MSTPKDSVPHAAFTQWLRELPDYVVLRNEADLFGNLRRGGDVDLLVKDLELAERTLIRHLGPPVRIIRSSYVTGYSYDWGHIDLLPTIEWRGACVLQVDAVLECRRLSTNGRPVPRIAHEALISWLTNLLFGGVFKERYAEEIRQAVDLDGGAFRQALIEVAGHSWGGRLWQAAVDGRAEISAQWARSLRRSVWWRACSRSPVRTIQRCFAFVIGELRLRFDPPVPWIAILACDSSRRSSLANGITAHFAACRYAHVKTFDWRPRLGARADGGELVSARRETPPRDLGSRLTRLLLAAEWLTVYWTRWVHQRAKGYIVTFDRMYFEPVVDPERSRSRKKSRLARAWWWMLPIPDLVFVLDSEPDAVGRSNPEMPRADVGRRRRYTYGALGRPLPPGHVLNGSLPVGVLVDEVQRVIRAWMLNRSVASFGQVQAALSTVSIAAADGSGGAPLC